MIYPMEKGLFKEDGFHSLEVYQEHRFINFYTLTDSMELTM